MDTRLSDTVRVFGKMVGKALLTNGGWLILGMDDFFRDPGSDRIYGIGENQEAIDELIRKISTSKIAH